MKIIILLFLLSCLPVDAATNRIAKSKSAKTKTTLIKTNQVATTARSVSAYDGPHDYRYVGNAVVDIGPLKQWLEDKKGERPLTAWKRIRVDDVIPGNFSWPRCKVRIEGNTAVVFLAGLPARVQQLFNERNQASSEARAQAEYVSDETARVRDLNARTPSRAPVGSVAGNQIRQANIAGANLENERDRLDEMNKRNETLNDLARLVGDDFAMFTGQRYAGLEVWTLGKR